MQLIKGRSTELCTRFCTLPKCEYHKIYELNKQYLDIAEKRPTWQLIEDASNAGNYIRNIDEVVLWLGFQHGELLLSADTSAEKGSVKKNAVEKATASLKVVYGFNNAICEKYLKLNETDFFDKWKYDDLMNHWMRRVGIDLRPYFANGIPNY